MQRGEIWWASLLSPTGSEPGYRRPVVIVSSNDFNKSNINTVIAAAITSNTKLAEAPGNFKINKKISKLKKESVVNISQLITLDKSFLTGKVSKLQDEQINLINEGLKLVLAF